MTAEVRHFQSDEVEGRIAHQEFFSNSYVLSLVMVVYVQN